MKQVPLNRQTMESRLREIAVDIEKLRKFKDLPLSEFNKGENFAIAEHYLRRALEAVFDMGNHILSRLPIPPGERPTMYKEIALSLGRYNIVPPDFAQGVLKDMAGYRNRLVHFYYEITKKELYQIIQANLGDLEKFCKYILEVMEKPENYGLKIK